MIRPTLIATLIYRSVFPTFESWSETNEKSYSCMEEYSQRAWIYHENLGQIHKHNQGNYNWNMSVNSFADLTTDEYSAYTMNTSWVSIWSIQEEGLLERGEQFHEKGQC